MTVLMLDSKEIERLKLNAEWNPIYSEEVINDINEGKEVFIPGDSDGCTMFSNDYKIVYTHEQQKQCICRHLSISSTKHNRTPLPEVVNFVCKEFGFINEVPYEFPEGAVWFEKIKDSKNSAVNVLEPIDGDFLKLAKESK